MAHSGVCLVISRKGRERNKDGIRKFKLNEKSNGAKVENALNRVAHEDSGSFAFVVSHLSGHRTSAKVGHPVNSQLAKLLAHSRIDRTPTPLGPLAICGRASSTQAMPAMSR